MDMKPITRIILQTEDGYYSLAWDETASITILPNSGGGTVTHGGKTYAVNSASQMSGIVILTNPTPIPEAWIELTLTPDDDVTKALELRGTNATLYLAPGDYRGQRVMLTADAGLTIDEGAATGIEFYR